MTKYPPRTVVLFGLFLLAGCQREEVKREPPPPLTVLYVMPTEDEVTEFEEFTGRTASTEVIELRARVGGYLTHIEFRDGASVTAGQVLFRIDDRPFQAEEQQAAAAIARSDARTQRLTSQLRRAKELLDKKAISENEYETVQFDLDEAAAALREAVAVHERARLNLDFTTITAPISGQIGRTMIDVGNIVTPDQTLLATIVPTEKMYVYFDMDERTVLRLRRLESAGTIAPLRDHSIPVRISLADSDEFALEGMVDFLDNQIDPATGTLRARATVDNANGFLSSGLFVRLKFPIGKPERSLLVPEESLASDQGRPFVFVVAEDEDGKSIAEARPVVTGPQVGPRRVIREGVNADDRIIVTGLQRLRRQMEITPRPSDP